MNLLKPVRLYTHLLRSFRQVSPQFLKYQVITKLIFSLGVFPLFWWLAQLLIDAKGMGAVSDGLLWRFLLTPQGIIFLMLVLAVVLLGIIIEMYGFICISARSIKGKPESSYLSLLKANLKQLPNLLQFSSLFLLTYILILVPLTGAGVGLSFFHELEIPNFIDSVIEENELYLMSYLGLIIALVFLSYRWIFTFQFMVIGEMSPAQALRASARLVKRKLRPWMRDFFSVSVCLGATVAVVAIFWVLFIAGLSEMMDFQSSLSRIFLLFLLLLQQLVMLFFSLLFIPFEVHHFTIMFYDYLRDDQEYAFLYEKSPEIPAKAKPSLLDRIFRRKRFLGIVTLLLMTLIAVPTGLYLEEILHQEYKLQIMAHRGGGFAAPENTVAGIEYAIGQGAHWSEIDVQRTADGYYVLNHDETFKRVAGIDRKVTEMTLTEIKGIDVGKNFSSAIPGERVPTLEEVLDFAKGRIKLNIELKGKSADSKMVDDVVAMVKERGMQEQVLLTTLNYDLVDDIESRYPEMNTGFIYFLAIGDSRKLKADYLILEEREAKGKTIDKLRAANKKIVVWTINKPEGMQAVVDKDIDAVITDDITMVQGIVAEYQEMNEQEMLLELFFRGE